MHSEESYIPVSVFGSDTVFFSFFHDDKIYLMVRITRILDSIRIWVICIFSEQVTKSYYEAILEILL